MALSKAEMQDEIARLEIERSKSLTYSGLASLIIQQGENDKEWRDDFKHQFSEFKKETKDSLKAASDYNTTQNGRQADMMKEIAEIQTISMIALERGFICKTAVEEMQKAISMLVGIENLSKQYYELVCELNEGLIYSLDELDKMISNFSNSNKRGFVFKLKKSILSVFGIEIGIEYSEFNDDEKQVLHSASQIIQMTKIVLEKPLLDNEGRLSAETKNYIDETDFENMIEGV
jgi:hypothetical protein